MALISSGDREERVTHGQECGIRWSPYCLVSQFRVRENRETLRIVSTEQLQESVVVSGCPQNINSAKTQPIILTDELILCVNRLFLANQRRNEYAKEQAADYCKYDCSY